MQLHYFVLLFKKYIYILMCNLWISDTDFHGHFSDNGIILTHSKFATESEGNGIRGLRVALGTST